jgi:anti-sigma-K factor RskA
MEHQNHQTENDDQRLIALFQAYHDALPDPDPSANFMPRLWQKIEARERASTILGRVARNVVTAALALTSILALAVSVSYSRMATLPSDTYVEVLAEQHAGENLDYFEPVHIEPIADQR